MKTLKLIEILLPDERKLLKKTIADKGNKKLELLLQKIMTAHDKQNDLPPSEELVLQIFKTPYSPKAATNLRNLFRLINDEIKVILIDKQLHHDNPHSLRLRQHLLLQALHRRSSWQFYEQLLKEELETCAENFDYWHYLYLSNSLLRYHMVDSLEEAKRYEQAHEALQAQTPHYQTALKSYIAERNVIITALNFGIQSRLAPLELSPLLPPYHDGSSSEANPYLTYIERKRKIYDNTERSGKTEYIKQNIAYLEEQHSYMLQADKFSTYSNLFVLYILQKDYQTAQEILEKLLPLSDILENTVSRALLTLSRLNMLSFCLKSFQFETAARILKSVQNHLAENPYQLRIRFFQIWYAIFIKDKTTVLQTIQIIQAQEIDRLTKFYLKLIECILFFEAADYEMTATWLHNLSQNMRYNDFQDESLDKFLGVFRKAVKEKNESIKKNMPLSEALQAEIKTSYDNWAMNGFYSLPIAWLYHRTAL